ncbi:MAG: FimB/Mfa2 family fimbrial subunit [Tannerellaceae bacterium]|jgi:hypothetical protein|nr:FimB/Mfa2 family fimbrial subunit [Tannerellaceae bacterium]
MKQLIYNLLFIFLISSCIKVDVIIEKPKESETQESEEETEPVYAPEDLFIRLAFKYTKNTSGTDKLISEVSRIDFFVFDSAGYFVERYMQTETDIKNRAVLKLHVSPGVYNFIAWGNLNENYELSMLRKGVTHIDDAQLSLKRDPGNTVSKLPSPLFHGGLYRKEIILADLQVNQNLTINMMKDTKEIKVTASGLALEDPAKSSKLEYGCTIISRNGDYKFDNTVIGNTWLQYIPQESVGTDRQLISNFVVMRELSDRSTASRLIVSRNSPDSDTLEEELINVDLVPILLALARDRDMDFVDRFEIELLFDFTKSTVIISNIK